MMRVSAKILAMLVCLVMLSTAFACRCRAEVPPAGEAREWLRIGIAGPHGDGHVWGWRRPDGQVGYYPHEQATAPKRSVGPSPGPGGVTNYGVDLSGVAPGSIGTFTSNAPAFRPPEPVGIGRAAERLREDMPEVILAAFGCLALTCVMAACAAFFRRST